MFDFNAGTKDLGEESPQFPIPTKALLKWFNNPAISPSQAMDQSIFTDE